MDERNEDSKFARATFRVWSRTHAPDFFVELFGRPADMTGIMGELKNPNGRSQAIFQSHVYLIYSGLGSSEPLESHIQSLLEKIESLSERFEDVRQYGNLDIFLGYGSENGQGGAHFSPGLLRRLAAIGLEVIFDLHPPESFADVS